MSYHKSYCIRVSNCKQKTFRWRLKTFQVNLELIDF